jgi:DNA-binding transcriptional MerR regulator
MKHPIEKERGGRYVGLPEFTGVAERVVKALTLEQSRGTVTSVPDERTIRYYLAEGLIQSPDERQGTASVFGYLHLLQLVAVKKLQAEHLPIRKIKELVTGKGEEELESLIGIGTHSTRRSADSDAKRYLESLLAPSMSPASTTIQPTTASRTRRTPTAPPAQAPTSVPEQTVVWQRLEIEPGLEVHIRSDYAPPTTSARTKSLADRIRGVIGRYWNTK